MNLDDLRAVQVNERGTDSLQSLPESFYRDVAAYVEDLREERERAAERAENPFDSDEVRRLSDEIETAEEVVEAIYERRVGKVVKRASLAAAGMPADEEGLTAEEKELFSALVERIEENRQAVLDVVAGDAAPASDAAPDLGSDSGSGSQVATDPGSSAAETAPEPPEPVPEESIDAAEVMGSGSDEPADEPIEAPDGGQAPAVAAAGDAGASGAEGSTDEERVTLRITRDVGEIFGVDERVYDLSTEDVVSLPEQNAKPLIERDAAQKLD